MDAGYSFGLIASALIFLAIGLISIFFFYLISIFFLAGLTTGLIFLISTFFSSTTGFTSSAASCS